MVKKSSVSKSAVIVDFGSESLRSPPLYVYISVATPNTRSPTHHNHEFLQRNLHQRIAQRWQRWHTSPLFQRRSRGRTYHLMRRPWQTSFPASTSTLRIFARAWHNSRHALTNLSKMDAREFWRRRISSASIWLSCKVHIAVHTM